MPSGRNRVWRAQRVICAAVSALLLVMAAGVASRAWAETEQAGTEHTFPRPPALESKVQFWVNVFTTYSVRDFIIHDSDHVSRVYQVLHLPGTGNPSQNDIASINAYLKTKYANILNRLATGAQPAGPEEQHVAALFKGEPLSAYSVAAQNLRVQEGLRERFREGLLRARYYYSTMERIFERAGLPPELVTLAEVESGFYSRAKSGAGAVGIWQFTRATGQQYMRITRYHDDRLNPITETEAAARLLRYNYETLGSWPLAITAYNYGTGGVERASAEYGGDFTQIVRYYNGPRFGFAAKNYYAEFLAALQVHKYEDKYFPDLKYMEAPPPPPVNTEVAHRRRYVRRTHWHVHWHHPYYSWHHRRYVPRKAVHRVRRKVIHARRVTHVRGKASVHDKA